jgi:hypothetical protein
MDRGQFREQDKVPNSQWRLIAVVCVVSPDVIMIRRDPSRGQGEVGRSAHDRDTARVAALASLWYQITDRPSCESQESTSRVIASHDDEIFEAVLILPLCIISAPSARVGSA